MEKNEILDNLLNGFKTITAFYPYPSGNSGMKNDIIRIGHNKNNDRENLLWRNFISTIIQLGASSCGYNNDNKIVIKLKVDTLDFPLYFGKYDNEYSISTEVNFSRSREIKTLWNIEY